MLRAVASGLEDRFQTLHEIVKAARATLAPGPWDYLVGATETETTLRRNRLAIDSLAFRPRVLRDVSKVDATVELPGQARAHPRDDGADRLDRELHARRRRHRGRGLGRVRRPADAVLRLQPGPGGGGQGGRQLPHLPALRPRRRRASSTTTCERAVGNGYTGFCLTVDTASYSRRERDLARRFVKPWRARATGFDFQAGLSWSHVKRFKDTHPNVPLILKGIATAEDAALAVEHGVDVVYVSNHGGRQLDQGRGSLDVLPEVVKAVGGRAKIIVDGVLPARHRRGEGHRAGRRPRGYGPDAVLRSGRRRRGRLRAHARADGRRDPDRAWPCSASIGSRR